MSNHQCTKDGCTITCPTCCFEVPIYRYSDINGMHYGFCTRCERKLKRRVNDNRIFYQKDQEHWWLYEEHSVKSPLQALQDDVTALTNRIRDLECALRVADQQTAELQLKYNAKNQAYDNCCKEREHYIEENKKLQDEASKLRVEVANHIAKNSAPVIELNRQKEIVKVMLEANNTLSNSIGNYRNLLRQLCALESLDPYAKNTRLLLSFVEYCKKNHEERFWQALRNWSDATAIYYSKEDTFYWQGRTGEQKDK